MPNEQSKAAKRRLLDPRFANRWFVGDGIDIGCGNDPLDLDLWPNINSLQAYDRIYDATADAQTMAGVDDEQFDFVHSSHCLEHMQNPEATLEAWMRILKPGGFIVCTVPDWVMYEGMQWPSRNNSDHKCAFTVDWNLHRDAYIQNPTLPVMYMGSLLTGANTEHLSLITTSWDPAKFGTDQTLGPAECAIEFVLQKHLPPGQVFKTMKMEEVE